MMDQPCLYQPTPRVISLVQRQIKVPSTLAFELSTGLVSHVGNGRRAAFRSRASLASFGRSLDGGLPPKPTLTAQQKDRHLRAAAKRTKRAVRVRASRTLSVLLMSTKAHSTFLPAHRLQRHSLSSPHDSSATSMVLISRVYLFYWRRKRILGLD